VEGEQFVSRGLQHISQHKLEWTIQQDKFWAAAIDVLHGCVRSIGKNVFLRHYCSYLKRKRKRLFEPGSGCDSLISATSQTGKEKAGRDGPAVEFITGLGGFSKPQCYGTEKSGAARK